MFFAARVVLAKLQNGIDHMDIEFKSEDESKKEIERVRRITRCLPDYATSVLRSGVSSARLKQVHAALADVGYFDDKCWAAEPIDEDSATALKIADNLKHFSGQRSWSVTPSSVSAYLSQFPISLREDMASALQKLTILDRDTIVNRMKPMFDKLQTEADIVAFTSTSGTQVHTWLKKELKGSPELKFHPDIRSALKGSEDAPLIFVDDNSASGVQARAQFLIFWELIEHCGR